MNSKVYGTWKVTTEGDMEGRVERYLGTHTGYIDEIALALADKCYYVLDFEPTTTLPPSPVPTKTKVNVRIPGLSNTSNVQNRADDASIIFRSRPVVVVPCNFYGAVTIEMVDKADAEKKIALGKALAKLTDEDKTLLGLA